MFFQSMNLGLECQNQFFEDGIRTELFNDKVQQTALDKGDNQEKAVNE